MKAVKSARASASWASVGCADPREGTMLTVIREVYNAVAAKVEEMDRREFEPGVSEAEQDAMLGELMVAAIAVGVGAGFGRSRPGPGGDGHANPLVVSRARVSGSGVTTTLPVAKWGAPGGARFREDDGGQLLGPLPGSGHAHRA